MHSDRATCLHACKQIADWLSGLAVACACFICGFKLSNSVDKMDNLHDDNFEKIHAICWQECSKSLKTRQGFFLNTNFDPRLSTSGTCRSFAGRLNAYFRGISHRKFDDHEDFYPTRITPRLHNWKKLLNGKVWQAKVINAKNAQHHNHQHSSCVLSVWLNLPRHVAVILCDSTYRLCAPKPSMSQQ